MFFGTYLMLRMPATTIAARTLNGSGGSLKIIKERLELGLRIIGGWRGSNGLHHSMRSDINELYRYIDELEAQRRDCFEHADKWVTEATELAAKLEEIENERASSKGPREQI